MRARTRFAWLLWALLLASPVLADAEAEEKGKKFRWEVTGEARFRAEWRDNFNLNDEVDDNTSFVLSRFRVGFGLGLEKDFDFYFQAQDSRVFGQEPTTATSIQNLDMHQGYVDLWRRKPKGWSARVGRQEWKYGNERLIGALNWSNVGRAFDGIQVRYKGDGYVVDVLGAGLSKTANGTGGTQGSDLYGAYFTCTKMAGSTCEGYWLTFSNRAHIAGETGETGTSKIHAVGGRTVQRFGGFDAELEAAYEYGRQNGDGLRAWAAALNVGYTFDDPVKIRPFVGYDFATGDENNADGSQQEFFNFFPTNHKHYGYMDLFGWRNIRSYYFGAWFRDGKHWAQVKWHRFSLQDAGGRWTSASGFQLGLDATGNSGRSVGWEMDLNYRYHFMKRGRLEAGIAWFEPGHFARSTRGPDPQQWAYLMFVISGRAGS